MNQFVPIGGRCYFFNQFVMDYVWGQLIGNSMGTYANKSKTIQ